jgi:hypothetical protein
MVMKEETGFKQRGQTVGHVPKARFPGIAVLGDRGTESHFPGQGRVRSWSRKKKPDSSNAARLLATFQKQDFLKLEY